jgi:hypothetical protein
MIISYVWVLETNTGATWRVSSLRIVRIDPVVVSLSPILLPRLEHYWGPCMRTP